MVKANFLTLFPAFEGKSLTMKYDVSCRFFTDDIYQLKEVPFISSLLRVSLLICF